MKRISLFFIPLVLLLAFAPLPSAANEGGGGEGGDRDRGTEDSRGFNTAADFFAYVLQTGNFFFASLHANAINSQSEVYVCCGASRSPLEKESLRHYIQRMVFERARRNAERRAQEAENSKRAENISDDELPGLDSD